MTESRLLNY